MHSVVRYVLSSSRALSRWEMRTEMTAPFLPQVYYWRVPSTRDGESESVRSSSVSTAATLPRWDVSVVFSSLESPEFAQGFQAAAAAIHALASLFDAEGIQQPGRVALR